jgi:hypothetical protein
LPGRGSGQIAEYTSKPACAAASARQSSLSTAFRAKTGGAEGIRTPDLLIANQPLYQLSYDPSQFLAIRPDDYYADLRPAGK